MSTGSVPMVCRACGITFYVSPAQAKIYNREHCSQACRTKSNTVTKICVVCEQEFTRRASKGKIQIYCSGVCRGKGMFLSGWRHSDESKNKMSRTKSALYAAGIIEAWNTGKSFSPEQRARMSDAKKKLNRDGYVNPRKGYRTYSGYRYVIVHGHPKSNKQTGYVAEHIIIAEKALGRYLGKYELVHHINGIKWDNRNTNLLIVSKQYHHWLHARMALMFQMIFFDTPDVIE